MTDGGDIPFGMDGEENVGGVLNFNQSRSIGRRNTLLVPLIEEVDDDSSISPSKDIAEETKSNWEQ